MSSGISHKAWLGLGGNIGDVRVAMAKALNTLDAEDDVKVMAVSPLYKTPPWGVTDQDWFLNCCAEIETSLHPEELLEVCQDVERAGKRERIRRWGPRTIDVDILIMEGVEQIEQRLTIPHPRIAERAFVLVPLADIAPTVTLDGKTISELATRADNFGLEKVADVWWKRTA